MDIFNEMKPEWIIHSNELSTVLDKVTLVDVREDFEYAHSRIENCVHIPMNDLPSKAEIQLKKDESLVVYCAHGVRSARATLFLRSLGFEDVRSLDGGIVAWEEFKRNQKNSAKIG